MDLLNIFLSTLTPHQNTLAKKTGMIPSQTSSVLSLIAPLLLKKIALNTSSPQGSKSLQNALQNNHDGSILNDIIGAINNPNAIDGAGILGHILGNGQESVIQTVARKTGTTNDQVNTLMTTIAPILMGVLGKEQRSNATQSGIVSLLSGLLDQNKDGSVVDDIFRIGLNFFKNNNSK